MALFRGRLVQRVRRFPEEYHDFGWKYGDLHHYYNGSFFTQISNIDDEQMETNTWDVVGHSVGQCTYLVIKGQDLYEGDIIKYSQHKGYALPDFTAHVVYIKELACFGYFRHDLKRPIPFTVHDELQTDFLDYCEIIGNTYENDDMIPKLVSESPDPLPF